MVPGDMLQRPVSVNVTFGKAFAMPIFYFF